MPRAFLFSSNRYLSGSRHGKNSSVSGKPSVALPVDAPPPIQVFSVSECAPLDLSYTRSKHLDQHEAYLPDTSSTESQVPIYQTLPDPPVIGEVPLCSSTVPVPFELPESICLPVCEKTDSTVDEEKSGSGRPKRKRQVKRASVQEEDDHDFDGLAELEQDSTKSSDYENKDENERFICQECGKKYTTASNLTRHRQTHRSMSDKTARKCPHCERIYVSSPAYNMHIQTHVQSCECPHCQKRFSRQWLLQGHLRTHSGEKPFQCDKCKKQFADKSNLRAHIQTHSNEKPYVCGHCGKSFALRSYLTKHEEASCGKTTSS